MHRGLYDVCYVNWPVWYDIARGAIPERWGFTDGDMTVFRLYMIQTFSRLDREGKVLESEEQGLLAFNTGLRTMEGYEIIVCLAKDERLRYPRDCGWSYLGWCVPGVGELGSKVSAAFGGTLPVASYASAQEFASYDGGGVMRVNSRHILRDNLYRFPQSYLRMRLYKHLDVCNELLKARFFIEPALRVISQRDGIVGEMCKEAYAAIMDDRGLMRALENDLMEAVGRSRFEVSSGKDVAVPIFYPRQQRSSFLMLLRMPCCDEVDLALVVTSEGNGRYVGRTVLDMHAAYIDARLVGPVNAGWLSTAVKGSAVRKDQTRQLIA